MRSPDAARFLTARQAQVLQAVVGAYVGDAAPVGSETITALLPVSLSPASVRTTLGELADLGLVVKPHRSAGREPTEQGFRAYVDQLLSPRVLGDYERRDLAGSVGQVSSSGMARLASRLLSERTRQLGFMEAPRLDRIVLRHVSFVRVSSERVMVVLIARSGRVYQRVVDQPGQGDQAELDRMAAALSERVAGQTLRSVQERLLHEASLLRSEAALLLERALRFGAAEMGEELLNDPLLVVSTRLALLEQPEFRDPERVGHLFQAIEDTERLSEILDLVMERGRVCVTFGGETTEPALHACALVAAPYGGIESPLGVLGVIGPRRMDYARVIPLVEYLSQLVTDRVSAE